MTKRFRHGLVLGKFYPLHVGHSNLIRTALRMCDRVTVELLVNSAETIPLETRLAWLQEEHPTANVVAAMDDAEVDFDSPTAWDEHMLVIEGLLDAPVDAVFTCDDYGVELARRLDAEWVQVDPGRVLNPVSGTAVRADVEGHWWALAPCVRASLAQRVVVLGAESTGSTTLASALAEDLGTLWVEEYGRQYSEIRPGGFTAPWRSDEFDLVVDRQIELEDRALRRVPKPLLICDTDVLATALWHERYVGEPAPRILERAAAHPPALYILTGDEIPFVQDGLRDGEHIRSAMQERFREVLAVQSVQWIEVRGALDERVSAALRSVSTLVGVGVTAL
ncbi:AAA family ATPase [uncultured Amnibacterium sp.]|uniref:AAA family ATPase n=1 Tax=uncultured Amnibacterium sp. TaxID=1631851 RepID=UPI0035C9F9B9